MCICMLWYAVNRRFVYLNIDIGDADSRRRTHIYNSYHVLLHLHMTSISDRVIGRRVVTGRPRNEVSSRFIE